MSVYTGYYVTQNYIHGPDNAYSGRFYLYETGAPEHRTATYIYGPTNAGRFYLSEPPLNGLRYVYDTQNPGNAYTEYYLTADGHFYGPDQRLPWFD